MPKSRKRRPRRTSSKRPARQARQARQARPASPPEHPLAHLGPWLAAMSAVDAAEARGDAAGALDAMALLPTGPDGRLFWRPWRIRHLTQILALGPATPGWVMSRWVLCQAMQVSDRSRRGSVLRAMDVAVGLQGGEGWLPGVDETDAHSRVIDRDWVFRQVLLYEEGGVSYFLRHVAAPDLVAATCRIEEWATATMGGYQLLGRTPGTTTWAQVGRDDPLVVPNIGTAMRITPGEHVIGRVVPTDEGWMFEAEPLRVPEEVARRVASAPHEWLDALTEACAEDPGEILTTPHYASLLCDVPDGMWQYAMLRADSCVRGGRLLAPTPGNLADVTLWLAWSALLDPSFTEDPDVFDIWACLAAAVLEPSVAEALSDDVDDEAAEVLRELSVVLAEPAATVCRRLADRDQRAA